MRIIVLLVYPILILHCFDSYSLKHNEMGKTKELTEGTRGQVVALNNDGLSHRKIAEKLRISKSGVQGALDTFRETKS